MIVHESRVVRLVRNAASLAALILLVAAAACMPAKAPGSDPGEMTATGHHAAAMTEQREAAAHRAEEARVQPTKPANEASYYGGNPG